MIKSGCRSGTETQNYRLFAWRPLATRIAAKGSKGGFEQPAILGQCFGRAPVLGRHLLGHLATRVAVGGPGHLSSLRSTLRSLPSAIFSSGLAAVARVHECHLRIDNSRAVWCPGAESNHRHCDFQSHALPTELPGRSRDQTPALRERRFIVRPACSVHHASPGGLPMAPRSESRQRRMSGISRGRTRTTS